MKKQNPSIIEGEIVDEKKKKSNPDKATSTPPAGPITERGLVFVILIIVAGGAMYFAYPWIKDLVRGEATTIPEERTATAVEEPLTPLERLTRIEDKLNGLEDLAQHRNEEHRVQLETLGSRLLVLEKKLDTIDLSVGGEVDSKAVARIQALEREIEILREALAEAGAFSTHPSVDFAQAVAQLAPPLYQSRQFIGELEQLRVLILTLPALEQATLSDPMSILDSFAETGIPSLKAINQMFDENALEALKTGGLPADAGWWDKTWARIKGLVVIRRTDQTDTSTLEGVIRQAELHLEAGNITAAIETIEGLPNDVQKLFAEWRKQARNRQAALVAFDTLARFVPRGLDELS